MFHAASQPPWRDIRLGAKLHHKGLMWGQREDGEDGTLIGVLLWGTRGERPAPPWEGVCQTGERQVISKMEDLWKICVSVAVL